MFRSILMTTSCSCDIDIDSEWWTTGGMPATSAEPSKRDRHQSTSKNGQLRSDMVQYQRYSTIGRWTSHNIPKWVSPMGYGLWLYPWWFCVAHDNLVGISFCQWRGSYGKVAIVLQIVGVFDHRFLSIAAWWWTMWPCIHLQSISGSTWI